MSAAAWRTGTIEFSVRPAGGSLLVQDTREAVTAERRCSLCGVRIGVTGVLDRAIVATDGSRYVAEFQAGLVEALLRASAEHEKEEHGG